MADSMVRRRRYHKAEQPIPDDHKAAVEGAMAQVGPVRRDKALPLLQAIQARLGHLPATALAYAAWRSRIPLADLNALVSFYDLLTHEPCSGRVAHVCDDIVCRSRAGGVARRVADGAEVHYSPCLGQCDRGPAALEVGFGPGGAAAGDGESGRRSGTAASYGGYATWNHHLPGEGRKGWPAGYSPMLLSRCDRYAPGDLAAYRALGGLRALEEARAMSPEELCHLLRGSKLVGRGGAAFPTGVKWQGVLHAPTPRGPGPDGGLKYVVVNADESEPGTFTNRLLMEEDPLGVVEAALIAAHGVGANRVYFYIRGEYPLAIERIAGAIEALSEQAGQVIMEIRAGSGAYVCGEETALFASIEGERGEPRVKPPFPTTNGLFDRPTLINNVETLHNLLSLLTMGVEHWNAVQPKLFSISGDVTRPGVYELPLGRPLSELIHLAGGPVGEVQAVLMGGAAGVFIGPDKLETPLEFKAMAAAGATLGSGAVMLFNTEADLWDVARRAARFFAEESCGKCVPCRIGTARQQELLERFAAGQGDHLPLFDELSLAMADASICGLGQTATHAVRSLLQLKGVKA